MIAIRSGMPKSAARMQAEDFTQPPPSPIAHTGLRTAVAALLNFALVVWLASAVLSLVSDSLILCLKNHGLAGVAGLFAIPSLLIAWIVYGLIAITPMVPKRVFLPLLLFGPVASLAALPILIFFYPHHPWITWGISLGQLIVIGSILYQLQRTRPFRWPLLATSQLPAAGFRWGNSVGFVAMNLLVVLPAVTVYLLACGSLAVNHFTAGFVSLRPSGLVMQVRKYQRDDGKTIELVAMSHVGESEFYQALAASFAPTASVLMEGVSDKNKVMSEQVGYKKTAESFGLAEQHEMFRPQGQLVAADVDIGQFSKATLDCLRRTMVIHSKGITAETLPGLMQPSSEDLPQQLLADLLTRRNDHLLKLLQTQLLTSDHIIIPWGAAHMPGISEGVLKAGFQLRDTTESIAIRFGSTPGK